MSLTHLHPAISPWFSNTLAERTAVQRDALAAIAGNEYTSIAAHSRPGETLPGIRALIGQAGQQASVAVNAGLMLTHRSIGQRIHTEILSSGRAGYGEQIVVTLSRQLATKLSLLQLLQQKLLKAVTAARVCIDAREGES